MLSLVKVIVMVDFVVFEIDSVEELNFWFVLFEYVSVRMVRCGQSSFILLFVNFYFMMMRVVDMLNSVVVSMQSMVISSVLRVIIVIW